MPPESSTFVFYCPRPKPLETAARLKQLDHFSREIEHKLYQCPIYCWLTEGFLHNKKKRLSPCYFLYIEYRNHTGASRYLSKQFLSLNEALTWLDTRAESVILPTLCSLNTRQNPIKNHIR